MRGVYRILACILVIVFIPKCNAISCYDCMSMRDSNCVIVDVNTTRTGCDLGDVCATITTTKESKTLQVIRNCYKTTTGTKSGCKDANGGKVCTTYCSVDLCNGGAQGNAILNHPTVFLTFVSLLLSYFLQ